MLSSDYKSLYYNCISPPCFFVLLAYCIELSKIQFPNIIISLSNSILFAHATLTLKDIKLDLTDNIYCKFHSIYFEMRTFLGILLLFPSYLHCPCHLFPIGICISPSHESCMFKKKYCICNPIDTNIQRLLRISGCFIPRINIFLWWFYLPLISCQSPLWPQISNCIKIVNYIRVCLERFNTGKGSITINLLQYIYSFL